MLGHSYVSLLIFSFVWGGVIGYSCGIGKA